MKQTIGDQIQDILQRLQDQVVDVARMQPYGAGLNDLLAQIVHLEVQLEKIQDLAGEMEEDVRRGLAITTLT